MRVCTRSGSAAAPSSATTSCAAAERRRQHHRRHAVVERALDRGQELRPRPPRAAAACARTRPAARRCTAPRPRAPAAPRRIAPATGSAARNRRRAALGPVELDESCAAPGTCPDGNSSSRSRPSANGRPNGVNSMSPACPRGVISTARNDRVRSVVITRHSAAAAQLRRARVRDERRRSAGQRRASHQMMVPAMRTPSDHRAKSHGEPR